jgi:hypothetical protein
MNPYDSGTTIVKAIGGGGDQLGLVIVVVLFVVVIDLVNNGLTDGSLDAMLAYRVWTAMIPASVRSRYHDEWRAEIDAMADRSRWERARWLASLLVVGVPKLAIVLRLPAWLGG